MMGLLGHRICTPYRRPAQEQGWNNGSRTAAIRWLASHKPLLRQQDADRWLAKHVGPKATQKNPLIFNPQAAAENLQEIVGQRGGVAG
jgi:hypothetical protein